MTLPYSTRLTTPWTISPMRSLNSLYWRSRSASRTFCTITCLAFWAAMRPKSTGGSGSAMKSPRLAAGFLLRASVSDIWVESFSTLSTTMRRRFSRISPDFGSISALISFSWP
jgi:hypothetical protein